MEPDRATLPSNNYSWDINKIKEAAEKVREDEEECAKNEEECQVAQNK